MADSTSGSNQLLTTLGTLVQTAIQKNAEATAATIANAQKGETIASETAQVYDRSALDRSTIVKQEAAANLQAQNAKRALFVAAGNDPNTGSGLLLDLMGTMQTSARKVMQQIDVVQQENAVGLLEDPVKWFKAQVDWDGNRETLAFEAAKLQAADSTIASITARLRDANAGVDATKEVITAVTAEALGREAAVESTIKANEYALQALKFNTAQVQAAASMPKEQLDMVYNYNNAIRQDQQMRLALEQFKWNREEREIQRTERLVQAQAKAENKQLDEVTLGYINTSRAGLGMPGIDNAQFQSIKLLGKGPLMEEMHYHLQRGLQQATAGTMLIGKSPAQSAEILDTISTALPQKRAEVARILARAQAEYNAPTTDEARKLVNQLKLTGSKNPAADFINQYTVGQISSQFANVRPTPENLFHVGDLKAYIGGKDSPGIAEINALPITQKLLKPLADAGIPLDNPAQVSARVIEAMRKGQLTSAEAVNGLVDIYRRANDINQASRGFLQLGIPVPDAGKHYYVEVNGTTVDFTNSESVGRYMSTELSGSFIKTYSVPDTLKMLGVIAPSVGRLTEKNVVTPALEQGKKLSDYLRQGANPEDVRREMERADPKNPALNR